MIHPEIQLISFEIGDLNRLLLARRGNRLDFITTELPELLTGEKPIDLAEQALRDLAQIAVTDLEPNGTIDNLQPPVTRRHMFKGSKIVGEPKGTGETEVAWYVPRQIGGLGLSVSFALSAVLYGLNRP